MNGSVVNKRAGTELGEQLQQHGVRNLAIEDDDAFDATLQRVDAGLYLGDHAAGNRAVSDQAARIVGRELFDQLFRLVEHAGNVGKKQQALGLERSGNGAGESIGIDVEGAAVGGGRDRRQNRNQFTPENLIEYGDVNLVGLADKAEIDDLFDVRAGIDDGACQLPRDNHVAVLAA